MKITLNDKLTKYETSQEYPLSRAITRSMGDILKADEKYQFLVPLPQTKLRDTGLLGLLSHAYSNHVKVAISPYDIWILIISEVSKFIVGKPEPFRGLFTNSDKKEDISVPTGSEYEMPMDVLAAALASAINFDASILFPQFSIESTESVEMIQALFCEMASPYYSYSMFMCGIPEIKVLGTIDDWKTVQTNFDKLFELLAGCYNFGKYIQRVKKILHNIVISFEFDQSDKSEFYPKDRESFWKDIFTQENVGSGGELEINGWVTHFLIVQQAPLKLTNFTNSIGFVKYKNLSTGNEYMSVHGGFDYDLDEEGFACLKYSKHIAMKQK